VREACRSRIEDGIQSKGLHGAPWGCRQGRGKGRVLPMTSRIAEREMERLRVSTSRISAPQRQLSFDLNVQMPPRRETPEIWLTITAPLVFSVSVAI